MPLGQMLLNIRKEHDLTQEEFAQKFHVTRQTVSNWENEKSYPDLKTLVTISETFGVSLDAMLKGNTEAVEEMNQKMVLGKYTGILSLVGAAACFIMWVDSLVDYRGILYPVVWLVCLLVCVNALAKFIQTKKPKEKGSGKN